MNSIRFIKPRIFKAHLAVLTANIIYGANYSIAKQVMPEFIKPFGFIMIRVCIATLLFWMCSFWFPREKIKAAHFKKLFVCALFGVAINQLFFFKGLSLTSPINSGLIMITNPIFVLLLAAILINYRITYMRILGIVLGISGCLILLFFGSKIADANSSPLGDFYILLNSLSYALYLIMIKPLMKIYHPITIMKWVFLFGSVMVIPLGVNEFNQISWSTFTSGIWWSIMFVIIGTTFFAYLFNTLALRELSSSQVSIYIYLQPLLAALFAIMLGTDTLHILHIVSALIIFAGVYLTSKPIENLSEIKG